MDQRPLERKRRYLLKHTSHTVPAFVSSIEHRTDIGNLSREPAATLEMNGIGVVNITLLRSMALDLYGSESLPRVPSFSSTPKPTRLSPPEMVTSIADHGVTGTDTAGPVAARERAARWGHRSGILELSAR